MAKDLMLVGQHDACAHERAAVEHRRKIHIEPVVVAREDPGLHKVLKPVFIHGNLKLDLTQLVNLPVVEQHVLRRGAGVAEAIADVPAEGDTVEFARGASPVPGVVIRPHAASPVEYREKFILCQFIPAAAQFDPAFGAHAVDLLVVVEMAGLIEGRGDNHALVRLVGELDDALDGLLVQEFVHVEREHPRPVLVIKGECIAAL